MNTNGMLQASEEEKLKMLNCCCMPPSNDPIVAAADTLILLALIRRIEQLEGELTKNGIDIPEWHDIFSQGIEKEEE